MVTDGTDPRNLRGDELIGLPREILEKFLPELSNRDVKSLSLITNQPSYHPGRAWLNLAHQVEGWEGISVHVIRQVKQQAVDRIKEAVTNLRLYLLSSSDGRGRMLLNVMEKLHRPAPRSALTRNKLAPYYVLKSLELALWGNLDSPDFISPPAGRSIANMLINNDVLTSLNLADCEFGEQGCRDIGEALAHNKTLTSLNLHSTGATVISALGIAAGLRKNTVLKSLDVSVNNELQLKGVTDIISAGNTLTALNLSNSVDLAEVVYNRMAHHRGVEPLIDALRDNTSLVDLDLSNTVTGRRVQRLIGDVLTQRRVIMKRVEFNDGIFDNDHDDDVMSFGDEGEGDALSIASILGAPIQSLGLGYNNIDDAATEARGVGRSRG